MVNITLRVLNYQAYPRRFFMVFSLELAGKYSRYPGFTSGFRWVVRRCIEFVREGVDAFKRCLALFCDYQRVSYTIRLYVCYFGDWMRPRLKCYTLSEAYTLWWFWFLHGDHYLLLIPLIKVVLHACELGMLTVAFFFRTHVFALNLVHFQLQTFIRSYYLTACWHFHGCWKIFTTTKVGAVFHLIQENDITNFYKVFP